MVSSTQFIQSRIVEDGGDSVLDFRFFIVISSILLIFSRSPCFFLKEVISFLMGSIVRRQQFLPFDMNMRPIMDIIIVNWNSGYLLRNCLDKIYRSNINKKLLRIIIVDNNSKDHSLDELFDLPKALNIKIIRNNTNYGFSKACNCGFQISRTKYVLLLNADVELNPNTLCESLKRMEDHPEIAVLGCRHIDQDGMTRVTCSRFMTFKHAVNDVLGLSKIAPNIFKPSTLMTDWDHENSAYVDNVIGAYMLIRQEALKEIGYFDERFFVYLEDIDLSHRLQIKNWKIYYDSTISVYHEGGGLTKNVKAYRLFLSLDSRIIFGKKYWKRYESLLYRILLLTIGLFTRLAPLILTLNIKSTIETLRAFGLLYRKHLFGRDFILNE